ncbi:Tm-1-like ATP-binding domain-containing protein [Rhizobium sp. S152]|uniref:Tm-1-like ATP-binding domain-containing protein n=1 Tax=Rhizobium sp. S152 TaxID=3055038 RepID=UPI0025A9BBC3|nr:Tm-1-like ATP-binding domain-containing protein [Rhizobium sp. S152]MDM9625272.1 Tm-1-like ATP-binding domain-containing protein [Rhizobium sp. S152]
MNDRNQARTATDDNIIGSEFGLGLSGAIALPSGLRPGIVIAATMDTKGEQVDFLRAELEARGVIVTVVDCGIRPAADHRIEIPADLVAQFAGSDIQSVRSWPERAPALAQMLDGLEHCVRTLLGQGLITGFIGIGGGTNAALAGRAFRVLPYGLPKILVSTAASGDTKPFIEGNDAVLIHPVVDFIGLNAPLRASLTRAAATMVSMLPISFWKGDEDLTIVGITAVGATTAAAEAAEGFFRGHGYGTYVFHARGPGGIAFEELIGQGRITGAFDLATTEISDEVLGGLRSAGPTRLEAAIKAGIPQVVIPGAVDLVNFGGIETVPDRYRNRQLITHTPASTLLRISSDESRQVGAWMARKLVAARAPVSVFVPALGFSSYDRPGSIYRDEAASAAFVEGLTGGLKQRPDIEIQVLDLHINDPRFVLSACERMQTYLQTAKQQEKTNG